MGCINGIDTIEVLASNGQPSVLFNSLLDSFEGNRDKAYEAYLKTQTDEFKNWFKDSKIVDENGEPKVLYHGGREFNSFSKEKAPNGFYFGSKAQAWRVNEMNSENVDENNQEPSNSLYPVFLNISNPRITNFDNRSLKDRNGYDGFIIEVSDEDAKDLMSPEDDVADYKLEYVAFEPNQIKSVFNSGEFSEDNDNIYYQKADNELIENVLGDPDIDTSRLDQMKDLIERQMKALNSRVRELEKTIKGLKPVDAATRQDTINRIKKLQDDIRGAETKEAFVSLITYAKAELNRTNGWLKTRFDADNTTHRDTLFALSKQLDNYAGLVVPHFATKHSELQNDIISINELYDDIKKAIPEKTIEVWAKIIAEKSKNKKFATKEDIEQYLKESEDIDLGQALLIDLSSSTDTILALVDKIYKEKMEEVHDSVHELREKAYEAGRKLVDAGYKDQDFMLEKDENGKNTGNIITRTSSAWKEAKSDVLSILESDEVGENGMKVRRKYIVKPKEEMTQEDLDHNIKLAEDKSTVGKFLRAERWEKGKGLVDGDNQRYTSDFKSARAKYEIYEDGKWVANPNIPDAEYQKYLRKYYKDAIETYVAVKEELEETDEKGKVTSRSTVLTGEVELQTFYWPKDEYVETTDHWNSDQYNKIMTDSVQREFYEFYTSTFKELMNKLPNDVARKMDGRVFRIKDEFIDSLNKNKPSVIKRVMRYLKELILPDVITNGRMLDENGYPINDVGIFYVGDLRSEKRIAKLEQEISDLMVTPNVVDQKRLAKLKNSLLIEKAKMNPEDLQYDLVKSLVQGGHMAENYHTMKSVESTFQMAREIVANKKYYKLDKNGDPKMDSDGQFEYKDEESRALKRLDTWMRMVYYNNSDANNTRMGHIAAAFKRYVSIGFQGLNLFSGINNVVTAEVNQWIEAAGARFYNSEQYSRANGIMNSHIAEMKWLTEMFKQNNKYENEIPYNKLTAMVEKFNFLEENSDRGGSIKQRQTVGQYIKSSNWAFAFIEAGEYQAQVKSAIAKMMNTEVELEDGTKTNVWDAYEFVDGKLELRKDAKFSTKDRIEITGQIKNMNKYIHGNHSSVDKVAMQETWYGELAMQFKRWMPNNFRSRFASQYMDESLDMVQEGRYRALIPFFNNLKETGWKYKEAMSGLNELEQANMKKNIAEVAMFGIAFALYIIFDAIRDSIPPDDQKLRAALNFLKKQSDRSMGEIDFFVNPMQWYQQAKNPVAGLRLIQEFGEFVAAASGVPFHAIKGDTEKLYYQKGPNKGKLKVVKEARDTMPILRTLSQWEQLDISGNFFIK